MLNPHTTTSTYHSTLYYIILYYLITTSPYHITLYYIILSYLILPVCNFHILQLLHITAHNSISYYLILSYLTCMLLPYITGLYMCSSGTHPGGGVMGAPGRNCAGVVLSDLGIRTL